MEEKLDKSSRASKPKWNKERKEKSAQRKPRLAGSRSESGTSTTTTGGSRPRTTAVSVKSTRNTRTKATHFGVQIFLPSFHPQMELGRDTGLTETRPTPLPH